MRVVYRIYMFSSSNDWILLEILWIEYILSTNAETLLVRERRGLSRRLFLGTELLIEARILPGAHNQVFLWDIWVLNPNHNQIKYTHIAILYLRIASLIP